MSYRVTLEYRRIQGSMLSTGRILSEADNNGLITEEKFETTPFVVMLKMFAREVAAYPRETVPDLTLVFQRTDREGIAPYLLDAATTNLFRDDPVKAIESFTAASGDATLIGVLTRQANALTPPPVLRAGIETLADAFGEFVSFRVRDGELECPCCGRWAEYATPALLEEHVGNIISVNFHCGHCDQRIHVRCRGEWGSVSVTNLLTHTGHPRFYLPRPWNKPGPWISRNDLSVKYNRFRKEKEKAR